MFFWHYNGFETKLRPFFGFGKSTQKQNQLSIEPITQIRCSSYCGNAFILRLLFRCDIQKNS